MQQKKANDLLKKDQGVNHTHLANREKTELIDALLDSYRLKELLEAVNLAKSSYFYHKARMKLPDKYATFGSVSRVSSIPIGHVMDIGGFMWNCVNLGFILLRKSSDV